MICVMHHAKMWFVVYAISVDPNQPASLHSLMEVYTDSNLVMEAFLKKLDNSLNQYYIRILTGSTLIAMSTSANFVIVCHNYFKVA